MPKFRKKPVVLEAFQINADGPTPTPDWFCAALADGRVHKAAASASPIIFMIATLEGGMEARLGDWVIQGVKGELYPCKPDIFAALYDQVD